MARSDRARPGLRKTVADLPARGRRAGSRRPRWGSRGRLRLGVLPVGGDDLADGEARLGVGDRRREQLGPGTGCRTAGGAGPSRRRSRGPTSSAARGRGSSSAPWPRNSSIVAAARRPAAGIQPDRASWSWRPRRWRTGRRRSRTTSARPRRARRWRRSPHRRRCRPAARRGSRPRSPAAGWSRPSPAGPSPPTASCAAGRPAGRGPAPGHAAAPPGPAMPEHARTINRHQPSIRSMRS